MRVWFHGWYGKRDVLVFKHINPWKFNVVKRVSKYRIKKNLFRIYNVSGKKFWKYIICSHKNFCRLKTVNNSLAVANWWCKLLFNNKWFSKIKDIFDCQNILDLFLLIYITNKLNFGDLLNFEKSKIILLQNWQENTFISIVSNFLVTLYEILWYLVNYINSKIYSIFSMVLYLVIIDRYKMVRFA